VTVRVEGVGVDDAGASVSADLSDSSEHSCKNPEDWSGEVN
jgi:hypothetical protein